jgi:AsmA-like C-terminal region/Protein of unknown function
MTRHGCLLLLRYTAALVAGLAIAGAVLVWRLTGDPISLDFLTPWVQQALSDPERGISVAVERTMLSHEPGSGTVGLVAQGVHVRRTDGSAEVLLPRIALDLSVHAALLGTLAPTRIVLTAPQLHLTRQPDGTIHLGLGEGAGAEDLASDILADLDVRPNQRGPLGYLREVAIHDAQLTLDDRALHVTWQARRADITLFRSEQGLAGDAQVTILAGDQEASIHADFRYLDAEHRLSGVLGIADLVPARFAAAAEPLALLQGIKLPVTGQVGFSIDAESMHIDAARADVAIGAGRIEDPRLANGVLPVTSGVARLGYVPSAARITIEELTLHTDGPEISFTGQVGGIDPTFLRGASLQRLDLGGRLSLSQVSVDDLARYWPEALSPHSRNWVTTHLHDGVVSESKVDLHLAVDFDPKARKRVQVDRVQGTLAFKNLTADYFPPLPPVQQIDGTGSFDRARFDLTAVSGSLQGLRLGSATIQMSKLDTDNETIAIAVGVHGPLRDTLQVIDTPPFGYARAVGLDAAKVSGSADTQLTFRFPLVHDLKIANVAYGAKATLKDVVLPGVAFGRDLGAGDLSLELDRAAFRVQGTAEIDGVPATLGWMQSLKPGDGSRRYTLKTRLDDAARRRFGVDFLAGYITGPIGVDLVYTAQKGNGEANLALDLKETALAVERLNWSKRVGVPAAAQLRLAFAGDHFTEIPEATVKGEGIDAALAIHLQPGGSDVASIEASRLLLGKTEVAGSLQRQPKGGWAATVTGKSLDASKLLKDVGKSGDQGSPLSLDAKLDRVLLSNDREVRNLVLRFVDDGRHWQTVVADAALTGGGKLAVRFGATPGQPSLRVDTNDMGAAFKLLGVSDNVVGGTFIVEGQAEDRGDKRLFTGRADGEDYKVVHAPLFARVLSVASFTAVNSMLSGEGIPFNRIAAKYTFGDGKLSVTDAKALGGAIGINVSSGTLDLAADTVDFSGTLAPAYTVNSLIGRIPLLGDLLVGGEGQGVFAANFRIKGPTADPKVSVNPLGMLAPGFVRKLFLFDAPPPSAAPNSESPYSALPTRNN